MQDVYRVERSMAVRLVGGHYCYTSESLRPFVNGIQAFIPQSDRFRFRQHLGSPEDIEFELQTYGVATSFSPMQKDGTWSTKWHCEWLETQRIREEREVQMPPTLAQEVEPGNAQEENETTIEPDRFDVKLGKSPKCREHTGNRRASHLCEMFYEQYQRANKYQKTEMAERIVQMIHESGGRFIKEEGEHWIEVDDLVARAKIAHFFRYKRSKKQQIASEDQKCADLLPESQMNSVPGTEQTSTLEETGEYVQDLSQSSLTAVKRKC